MKSATRSGNKSTILLSVDTLGEFELCLSEKCNLDYKILKFFCFSSESTRVEWAALCSASYEIIPCLCAPDKYFVKSYCKLTQ